MKHVMTAIIGAVAMFFGYLAFVWMPVAFYADAECLRAGYPQARVTLGLSRYCSTLNGAVTVTVKKQ